MKRKLFLAALAITMAVPAFARDTVLHLSVQDALSRPDAQGKLNKGVTFYFGKQQYGQVDKSLGDDVANTKTNAFNKSDEEACHWTFLSAMIELQEKARKLGADAVVDIESYYKKVPFVSDTEFECHAGGIVAGVALRGRYVKLK